MLCSWGWLKELVEIPAGLSIEEVAKKLTFAGLQIESIARRGESFSGVVVATVLAKKPHPKSTDKKLLTIVTVDDGRGPTEVVCGAPNVPDSGRKVLWGRVGARLPDGRELAPKEIAGVMSPGMLCSQPELGLGTDGAGIIVLDGEDAAAPNGTDANDALGLRDLVLDVNVTANRPDCLGHLGVAREIAALFNRGGGLRRPDVSLDAVSSDRSVDFPVAIADAQGCPRYTARVIEALAVRPSPRWMRRRLEAVGVRPISNLVDVTNYVMFELGHPLHAFDLTQVGGRIEVRRAGADKEMVTLDGQTRALVADDLLITDGKRALALAGVMGGQGSEVGDATTGILLEAATFDPRSVRRTAKRLGLHSESSHRFERGVDAEGVEYASARAARLLAELGGGRVRRGVTDVYPRRATPITIPLRPARVAQLLGIQLPPEEVTGHLTSLGCTVSGELVTPPTFRPDLEREVDLIEEIARLHGFESIPATLPAATTAPPSPAPAGVLAERVRDGLASAGLDEAISMGFTSPARIAALRLPQAARAVAVTNPMRPEQAMMRTSLLANLLPALAHNLAHGVKDVRIFEVGEIFLPGERPLPDERTFAAGVLCGARPGWLHTAGEIDFFDARGVIEHLFATLGMSADYTPARREFGWHHPGVAADIVLPGDLRTPGGKHVGLVGEVHPETRAKAGIEERCFAFELNLTLLPALPVGRFAAIPRYPSIGRDVSFFVDESTNATRVRDVVRAGAPAFLVDLAVLEDYRDPGKVPAGKKGMLWSMTYRADDRTLTDAEVDAAHAALVDQLLKNLNATRR
jgi:phenylalanyl-tRNA synthetase beta chain